MTSPFRKAKDRILFSDITTYAESDTLDFEGVYKYFAVTAAWSGTTPNNLTYRVSGSLDDLHYHELAHRRIFTSPEPLIFHGAPIRYLKAEYTSRTGGDATTSFSLNVVVGANS